MKVTKIKIDSLFGIQHLELNGNPVELRGAKGTGKTSVIDSIRLALTNQSDRDYIIKQGNNEGHILIETDSGISIERKKRTEKTDFNKITEFGKAVNSPQAFVNDIFTPLQLNPVEFASWDKNKQNRAILDLIEFEWDMEFIKTAFGEIPRGINYDQHILQVLDDIQAKKSPYYMEREDINREELYKRQSASDIAAKIPANYDLAKWEGYSLAEKIKELQTIQESNKKIDNAMQYLESYNNKVRGLDAEKEIAISSEEKAIAVERDGLNSTIARLKAEITSAEDKLKTLDSKLDDKKKIAESEYNEKLAKISADLERAKAYEGKTKQPTADLQAEIETAEKMKSFISEYKSWQKMITDCDQLKEDSAELTRKITVARELPGKVLETATIPVKGLTVQDGLPLINGLPVSNLSGGERIELCVDITLSKTQNLQMILLDGVEALDTQNREKLYQKCKESGLQVIAARTTDDNEFNIVEL